MFSKIQLFPNEHIITDKAESGLYAAEKIQYIGRKTKDGKIFGLNMEGKNRLNF
jgi:hypothetical protein